MASKGLRRLESGVRRDYVCTPVGGAGRHRFTILLEPPATPVAATSPPPKCRDHPRGQVVRDGTYARREPDPLDADEVDDPRADEAAEGDEDESPQLRRQRYRCVPHPDEVKADIASLDEATLMLLRSTTEEYLPRTVRETVAKKGWHNFTPDLSREHVCDDDGCEECEEKRGIHHGEQVVARRQSWNLRLAAEGLSRVAAGDSYAAVSKWAWRVTKRKRTRPNRLSDAERARRDAVRVHKKAVRVARRAGTPIPPWPEGLSDKPLPPEEAYVDAPRRRRLRADGTPARKPPKAKRGTARSRNQFHTAADWVEMYAPVLWGNLEKKMLAEEQAQHAVRRRGGGRPSVLLIDDIPVSVRLTDPATGKRRNQRAWFVLGAATLTDNGDRTLAADDLDTVLRLLRAYPSNNATAWKLLFTELGFVPGVYEPEFILADAGTGLLRACREFFTTAVFIPSLWHIHQALTRALTDTPGASVKHGDTVELLPVLANHLASLTGTTLRSMTAASWGRWWDDLEGILVREHLPVEKVAARRDNYETVVATALPLLAANKQIPVSTGGFETVLRRTVQKVLAGRKHAFRSIERTNHLLDLVVCRDRRVFDKLIDVVTQLRADQTSATGWATAPRVIADPQPPMPDYYASLHDQSLLPRLAGRIPAPAAAPPKRRSRTTSTSAKTPTTKASGTRRSGTKSSRKATRGKTGHGGTGGVP